MKNLLSVLLAASLTVVLPYAAAETATKPAATEKKAAKKPAKKTSKKAAKTTAEPEPDVTAAVPNEYACKNGAKITVYRNADDMSNVAMRWDKKLYRMARIETESGAERLEHAKKGLVFIGVPSKAMLFDSKKKGRLADECQLQTQ